VGVVLDLVDVLTARGQPVDARGERELDDLEGKLGARGLVSDAAQPSSVQRHGDKARTRATLGEEAGEVHHGYGVPLSHEGDDDEVRRWRQWWRGHGGGGLLRGRHETYFERRAQKDAARNRVACT
jgi:hypothetical protein